MSSPKDVLTAEPLVRRHLADCLDQITRGVGKDWPRYRVLGATRAGLAPAKEAVGKKPERYKLVEPGTIFYNPMRILLGSIAMVDDGDEAGITSPDYVVVKPRKGVLHHRWLYFWLRSANGADFIRSLARGAVRERLLFRRLARAAIEMPVYENQLKFAEAIPFVSRARAAAEARLEAVDQLRDSILAQAFHADFGWRKRSLEDLADSDDAFADGPFGSNLKTVHYATSGARVIRLQNIGRAAFLDSDKAYVSFEHYQELARHAVKSNDVIVAALGSGARPAGRACLIPDGLGLGLVKADCFRVRLPAETVDPLFLVYWLNSRENLDHIADNLRGATRPRFTLGMLRSTTVPAPPLDEQKKTAADVSKRLQAAATCRVQAEQELQLVRSFPGALLRSAFSGEL